MSSTPSSSEWARRLLVLGAVAALGACSDGTYSNESGGDDWWWGDDAGSSADTAGTDTAESDGGGEDLDITLVDPAVTDDYVFIGLASQGALVRIGIEGGLPRLVTTRLGFVPRSVIALDEGNEVVAISSDGSRIAFVTAVVGAASDAVVTENGMRGANRVSIGSRGDFVFVWHDASLVADNSLPRPLGDIVAIDLESREAFELAVGLYVRDIAFSADGSDAFVVTDEGISVIDLDTLDGDGYFTPVAVADETTLGVGREVLLVSDGEFVAARDRESATLTFTRLADGERANMTLPGAPSDLELIDGGTRVALSLPSDTALRFVDPAEVFAEGSGVYEQVELGFEPDAIEVSPDGSQLLTWAPASDGDTHIERVSVGSRQTFEIEVRKPVVAAAFSPDGEAAIVFHSREEGSVSAGDPPDVIVARSFAYTVLRLDDSATKLVLTQSAPTGVAFDESGVHAMILLPQTGRGAVDWARLTTFQTTTLPFAYPPEYAGTIPGTGTAFIVQDHPRGRIAFVTLATERIQEITGFELNALIE